VVINRSKNKSNNSDHDERLDVYPVLHQIENHFGGKEEATIQVNYYAKTSRANNINVLI